MAAFNSVKLSLYLGPVPVPAPPEVVDALSSARVVSAAERVSGRNSDSRDDEDGDDTQSGFELVFDLPLRSPLRTIFLLSGGGGVPPLMRVVLVVQIGGRAESVIDGVMTNVETRNGAGGVSALVVKGKDMSALMQFIEFNGLPYPAMPPALRVLTVLAKYAAFGVVPMVIPSIVQDIPIPLQRIPQQRGTDYAYVRRLAQQCGHVFYLDPGPVPGASTAYWGPEIRIGAPQPALSTNMDGQTNVEQLSFNVDKEKKLMPIVFFQEPNSKAPIGLPIPDISPLNPPLGLIPPLPPRLVNLNRSANLSPISAFMGGLAFAAQHSDSVFGTGRLDVARYGRLLKARQLVGVRGAGLAFDGLYYVKTVTHEIKRGEYKQDFTLARNGLVSTVSAVPV